MTSPYLKRLQDQLQTDQKPVKPPQVIDNSRGPVLDGKLKPDGEPIDDTYKDVKPKFKINDYGTVTKDEYDNTRIKYKFPINMLDNSGDTTVLNNIPGYLQGKKVKNPLQNIWKMIDGDTDINKIKFYDDMDDKYPGFNKTTLEDADFFIGKHNWFGAKNIVNGLETFNELAMALVSMGYNKMLDPEARKRFEAMDVYSLNTQPGMFANNIAPTGLKSIDNPIPDSNVPRKEKDPFVKINDQSVRLVSGFFKAIATGDFKKLDNAEQLYFKPLRDNFQKRPLAEQMFIGLWSDPILGKTIGWGSSLTKAGFTPLSNKVIKARGGNPLKLTNDLNNTINKYVDTEITLMKVFGQNAVINNKLDDNLVNSYFKSGDIKVKVKSLLESKKKLANELEVLAKKQNKSIEDTYEYVNDVFNKKTLADDTKAFEELKELNIADPVPFFQTKINALKNYNPNTIRGRAKIAEEAKIQAAEVINKQFEKSITKTGLDIISGDVNWYKKPFRKIWWEYKATDQKAVMNRVTRIAAEEYKKLYGKDLPDYMNSEYLAALLPGKPKAALMRASEVTANVMKTIGKNIPVDEVNTYLKLKHALAVYKMYPDRLPLSGYNSQEEIGLALREMEDEWRNIGGWEKIQNAGKVVTDFYKEILQRKLDSGMISREWFDELTTRYPDYNPTVYLNKIGGETKEQLGYFATWQGGITDNGLRKFSDAGSDAITENPLDLLKQSSLFAEKNISRNDLAKSWIKNIQNSNIFKAGEIKEITPRRKGEVEKLFNNLVDVEDGNRYGKIQFWEDGNIRTFQVPKSVAETFKLGNDTGTQSAEAYAKLFRVTNGIAKTVITGLNPAFWAVNLLFDTLTVMIKEGVTYELPVALYQAIKGATKGNNAYSRYIKSGADVYGYFGKTPEQISKEIASDGNIVIRNAKDWSNYLSPIKVKNGKISSPLVSTINEVGHTLETMPRLAVFNKRLAKGQSEILAGVASRRATVDFARSGQAVRFLNNIIIYFNAGVQGTLLPYRTLVTGDGVKLSRSMAAGRIGTYTMMHGALAAYNMTYYPEVWNSLPDYQKYGVAFAITGQEGKDAVGREKHKMLAFIPDNREFSQFTAPLVFLLEQMMKENATAVKEFAIYYSLESTPASRFTGETGLPVPFVADKWLQLGFNRDYFRDKDIVPPDKINLDPVDQFDEYTSEWAKDLGQATGLSPMKLEWALDVGVLEDVILPIHALYKVATGKQELIDPELERYVVEILLLSDATGDKDEIRKAFNRIKVEKGESFANKVRAKVLQEEKEDTPFLSKIKRKFVKDVIVDSNVWRTGAKIAERETGISNKAIQAYLEATSSNSLEAKKLAKEAGEDLKLGKIDSNIYKERMATVYAGPGFALAVLFKDYPELKQIQDDETGDILKNWFEKANTFGNKLDVDRRTEAQLLVDQYYSIPTVYVTNTATVDPIKTAKLKDMFIDTLTKNRKEILIDELTSKMDPVAIQEYKDKDEYLKDYWSTTENYIKEKDASLLPAYQKYQETRLFSEEKAKLILEERQNRKLKALLDRAGDLNRRARQKNEVLDAVVAFWTQSNPVHPKNKKRIREGFTQTEIYTQVRKPEW